MKKILIAGGAGFLGTNLCNKLVQDNYIYCLDNLSSGNLQNIQNLSKKDNFEFIQHDIINPIDIKIDEIYNLACPASPIHYQKDPINTLKTSVFGIYNLLELAKKYNAKILQASTSEVYGDPLKHPQTEEYLGNVNPIGIRSCYDEGKRCAEALMMDYYRVHKIKIKIVRIFNTYGPKMLPDDGRVVSNFIVQALQNKDITIYGTGTQTRSFCYVDDLINGLILMMNSDDSIVGPINLGNSHEYTILETAKLILSKIKSKSKIVYKPILQDDPKKRKPDINKALKILNWAPVTHFEKGLDETIKYFKELL